jgi:hypothetical protein
LENVFTLMVFPDRQTQAVVLQYKTASAALSAQDLIDSDEVGKVTVADDYGRRLRICPADTQLTLMQDVDAAIEGNALSMVKNNAVQALTQMKMQNEIDNDPKMKAAVVRSQLQQGVQGAFRQ